MTGAVVVWVAPKASSVMAERIGIDGSPADAPVVAWAGSYDAATAATVDDQVVIAAIAGQTTFLVSAPLGVAPYRELGLLGGISGASPMVVAGGERLAPSVGYGGLLVNPFDDVWTIQTSSLAVLTPNATQVAATANDHEAMLAWPTSDSCFIERVFASTRDAGWVEPVVCGLPRLASTDEEAALVYERDGNVYVVHGAPEDLHPAEAILLAAGHAPRIAVVDGVYWVSYLDANNSVVVGAFAANGTFQPIAEPLGSADAHELAIVGGSPRVFAATGGTIVSDALCVE